MWESSNIGLADFNDQADPSQLIPIAEGSLEVKLSFTNPEGTVLQDVQPLIILNKSLTKLQIEPAPAIVLPVNSSQKLRTYAIFDDFSQQEIIRNSDITYYSSNPSIASVDSSGLIQSISVGSAQVWATLNGVKSNVVDITTNNATLQSLTMKDTTLLTVKKGGTLTVGATAHYSDGTEIDITNNALAVFSSSDSNIAYMTANVLVSNNPGMVKISVCFQSICSNPGSVTDVQVLDKQVIDVILTPEVEVLPQGYKKSLTVYALLEDNTTLLLPRGSGVTFTSVVQSPLNPAYPYSSTIDANGIVAAVNQGSGQFKATYQGVTSKQATSISVIDAATITLTISAPGSLVWNNNTNTLKNNLQITAL
ncbi:MAG TPA: hypothetical protein DCY70_16135, partial [Shewanella sp.]|nr:hypothetical protein [Shewanella sp.]